MAGGRFINNQIKIALFGEEQTGKTGCVMQYGEGNFSDNYTPTFGVTFAAKNILVENEDIRLQIWDTSGNERYKSVWRVYSKDAHGVFVFFDVTQPKTFLAVDNFIRVARESQMAPQGQIFLVGNKLDLVDKRQVSEEEARNKAKELEVEYREISAKDNDNVHGFFQDAVEKIMKNQPRLMQNSQTKLQEVASAGEPSKHEQLPFYKKHTKKIIVVAFALAAIGVILSAWFWPLIVAAVPVAMVTGILSSVGVAITAKSIAITAGIVAGSVVTLFGAAASVAGSFVFAKISALVAQCFFRDENHQTGGAQKNYQGGKMPNIHQYLPYIHPYLPSDPTYAKPIPTQPTQADTHHPSLSSSTSYSLQSEDSKNSSDESFVLPRFG